MSATAANNSTTNNTFPAEQIDLGQLPMATGGGFSSARYSPRLVKVVSLIHDVDYNNTQNSAPFPPRVKLTLGQLFRNLFGNNEADPVKVTPGIILSRAWSILVILFLGVLLLLPSDGGSNSLNPADHIQDDSDQRPTPPPVAPPVPRPRVKLTAWRILNTSVLVILGTYKAVSAYLGQTVAPSDLDWAIGVLWALISYWLSIVEQEAPSVAPWFFIVDLSRPMRLWAAVSILAVAGGMYWSVIYGIMVFMFAHPINWSMLRFVSVGLIGFLDPPAFWIGSTDPINDLRSPTPPILQKSALFSIALKGSVPTLRLGAVPVRIVHFHINIFVLPYRDDNPAQEMEDESELVNMFSLGITIPCHGMVTQHWVETDGGGFNQGETSFTSTDVICFLDPIVLRTLFVPLS
ncbi:hypothetical protein B0H16DRAFT_1464086 [Mycena metata]|uniref:Uncharacterized protein n=1 Tax=Mycena metata TaxID=1033252 RepID=A0AAD7IGK3_9AGAR|nr:hypothetical protein B0H16DRAFT_1464086 [Mycena metata]